MKNKLLNDKRGTLYVYMVLIITIIAGVFFWFLFANVVQAFQETLNPTLVDSNWMTNEHYNAFVLAANFVTYLWQFLVVLVFFVLGYWVYVYSQRRGVGYE